MGRFHDDSFPGESEDYRRARDDLLAAELDLRRRIEEVAVQRRSLPLGGRLKQDYIFSEAGGPGGEGALRDTLFSELFAPGTETLVVYSFMYPPDGNPCPMCTSFLDSLDGSARHIAARANLAVLAKAAAPTLADWARTRKWRNLRLLSSGATSYNTDYVAERQGGNQIPTLNVFQLTPEGIFHSYASELLFASSEEGQHPRHMDLMWPLWGLLDLTPGGRGDWMPALAYG
ncbi:MAG: hypothetical protein CMM08_00550 [Rhodospirillaceae bacterium]|nr:hypothetical protein [Rhodospirillaceae bacterium]